MKLLSKQRDGKKVRYVYDSAKTHLQRLLLSGVLPAQKQQELLEVTHALDPIRLSPGRYQPLQVRTLQRGMRKIRAHLLETVEEQWQEEVIRGPSPPPSSHVERATRISWSPIEQTAG